MSRLVGRGCPGFINQVEEILNVLPEQLLHLLILQEPHLFTCFWTPPAVQNGLWLKRGKVLLRRHQKKAAAANRRKFLQHCGATLCVTIDPEDAKRLQVINAAEIILLAVVLTGLLQWVIKAVPSGVRFHKKGIMLHHEKSIRNERAFLGTKIFICLAIFNWHGSEEGSPKAALHPPMKQLCPGA